MTTQPTLRVVLAGYGSLGAALLRGLLASDGCTVVGVFRWESTRLGTAMRDDETMSFRTLVNRFGLPDIRFGSMNDYPFTAWLTQNQVDLVLVGSWGEILKRHLLDLPDLQMINCHPALLPAHRGANPYSSVILSDERFSGVTFHRITEGVDEGPILLQETLPVQTGETGESLRGRTSLLAESMVPRLIAGLRSAEGLAEINQAGAVASYFPPLRVEDGLVDFSQSAERILCRQRALYPWLLPYTFIAGKTLVRFNRLSLRLRERDPGQAAYVPGTVLSLDGGRLQVATVTPGCVLESGDYAVYRTLFDRWGGFLPAWLSRWWLPRIIRPGHVCGPEA
ncbi:MAG: methionyl-tRNA formyltransferase [Candidatus Melainabacteria bacterium]